MSLVQRLHKQNKDQNNTEILQMDFKSSEKHKYSYKKRGKAETRVLFFKISLFFIMKNESHSILDC